MRTTLAWTPAAAVASLIFFLSGIPGLHATDGLADLVLRKGAHLAIFGALALAISFALTEHGLSGRRHLVTALVATALYAVSDEVHQSFTGHRNGTGVDVLLDTAGALAALTLLGDGVTRRLRRA